MKRFIICLAALIGAPAMAQTTLDITLQYSGNTVCSYATGAVTNGATPGHLQAQASSASGAGCTAGNSGDVTFGPASPLSPQSTQLSGPTGNVNFSFQALNATSCTAAITGLATGSFTGGSTLCSGTGASTCSNRLVTATASFANTGAGTQNDLVTLTCTGGASGQAQSTATVAVPPKIIGGNCPAVPGDNTAGVTSFTQQGTTTVKVGGDQHTITADMTQFSSVLGPFPGRLDIAYDNLNINNYISMQFQAPAGFFANAPGPTAKLPQGWYSWLEMGETGDDTKVSMTISTKCGDFLPTTDPASSVVKNCYVVGAIPFGGIQYYSHWADPASYCVLQDNTTYYFNIISANISNLTSTGGAASSYKLGAGSQCKTKSSCQVPIENGPRVDYPGY
jgi:hypothetical protein